MNSAYWDTSTELGRLFSALRAGTQIEAAGILGVRQSALSDCQRRGNIVTGNVLKKAVAIGISPEWIQKGNPPMRESGPDSNKKCGEGRYCLETCPALEAARQVVKLIEYCPHICRACEHTRSKA